MAHGPTARFLPLMLRCSKQSHRNLTWVVVGILGAIEGLYGRTEYYIDPVAYLNVSRALLAGDWKLFFDPMWTPGYPALVAFVRTLFPHSATGEWYAISGLNWAIFMGSYASLRYLLLQAAMLRGPPAVQATRSPLCTWAVCVIFLAYELCFDTVSRVTPDLLVSALFILGAAQLLRVLSAPTAGNAAVFGTILGLGCWTKGVFLSYSAIFILVLLLALPRRWQHWRSAVAGAAAFLLLLVPYVAAISWSSGELTLGATGQLNYAFHVNGLPHWVNWQGGPPQFGTPLHHSRQLLDDLPVFEFATPFQSTYPPYDHLSYWYQGYRHFFELGNQFAAVLRNGYFLTIIVRQHPVLKVMAFVLLVIALRRNWRQAALRAGVRFWPLLLPCALGVATYLLVHVEARYLAALLMIPTLLPLALMLDPALDAKRIYVAGLVCAYIWAAGWELRVYLAPTVLATFQGQDFHQDPQWRLAAALHSYGLRPGDGVALIGGDEVANYNYRCSWAYVAELRIIAEFGAPPWRRAPWDRAPLDGVMHEAADANPGVVFWQLPEKDRLRVVRAFQATGARAVLSLFQPDVTSASGWRPVGDTGAWIYSF